MAEVCDFDELAALLEEDSDEEFQQADNVVIKTEPVQAGEEHLGDNNFAAESSDDDIDEDELDRLAGLVEEQNESVEDSKTVKTSVAIEQEPRAEEKEDNKTAVKKEIKEKKDEQQIEDESEKDENSNNEEKAESDNDEVQEKIQQMYAMIQQLQSQVSQKSKKKSGSKTVKDEPSNETDKKKSSVPATANRTNKLAEKSNEKKSLSTKLKLIEEDIFSKSSQDAVPSTSTSTAPKPKADETEKAIKQQPEKTERLYTVKEAQQQIFGSDSDSDWEGLDGEKPSQYNKSGQDIKQLMKKQDTQRVANKASYDVTAIANRKPSWGKKDVYKPRTAEEGSSSGYTRSVSPPRSVPLPKKVDDDDKNVLCDTFSELRIINPRISSTQLKMRMDGRHMFQMSTLHRRVNTADMEKDWVTIGVLLQKSEPKMSSKGKQYSIWTLSDLKDCQKIVKMFLFGDVHTQHWKSSIGSVLGFLNPNPMSNNEKYQNKSDDVTLCVDNSNKIMFMGQSKDFGYCKSFTKAGRKCTNFVNKNKVEFCEYHISAAYKTASSKRGDLQGAAGGPIPIKHKPSLKQKVLANSNESWFYGGQSFSSSIVKQKKKGVTMNSLQSHEKTTGPLKRGHVTTLSLYEMRPEDAEKLEKYEENKKLQEKKAFHELLAAPTVGSMNLVKHLIGNKEKEEKKPLSFQSVTAKDMFKERSKMAKTGFSAVGNQSTIQMGSPSPLPSTSKSLPKLNVPQLGKGFGSGDSIFLESPTKKKAPLRLTSSEIQKRKAVEKIKKKGGVKAENPNAVKKKIDENKQEKIKKRLCEDSDGENQKNDENVQAKKKPRLAGGVDLDDPEVQKLLKKKSKHDNLLLEVEQEKQDEYFDILEKKEKMETKMGEITKVKVRAVSCKKCGYTSFKAADRCREEKHPLVTHDAIKRFFVCQHCKYRTYALDRLPKNNCNCGKNAWQRTSMHKEKKGPKLESEELNLRGEEIKFLSSVQ